MTAENEKTRLNLGAGNKPMPGYENIDIKGGIDVTKLPHADDSVDEIRASHVLEHISYHQTLDVLRHWFAKLKPGGIVKVAVPNLEYVIAKMEQGATDEPLEGFVMGGHSDEHDVHKSMFTYNKLDASLRAVGFECVVPWESDFQDCSSLPVSLNLQATKPAYPARLPNVCVLMSVPRLMWTDNVVTMHKTLNELGMQLMSMQGCFWGQCLERCMEETMRKMPECTHFLTCDYDSVFSVDQVRQLYSTAMRLNADAIFPVQCKRAANHAMLSAKNDDGTPKVQVTMEEMRKEAIRCATGHFGLTLIKVDALKNVPKPWFQEIPDDKGGWGEGHVDPDIWFWKQWEKSGRTLYQANHVRIGHAQIMATFPDRLWRPVHIHMNEFHQSGVPLFAR